MDPIKPTNSVERRMLKINDDWRYFTEKTEAKWLYWQLPEADFSLLETFFQVQSEYANGVQFYRFEFLSEKQYYTTIIDELYQFYDSRRQGSIAQGINADWQLPVWDEDNESLVEYFFKVLKELSLHHPDLFPFFTFIFVPYQYTSQNLFSQWGINLLAAVLQDKWIAEHVRFVSYGEQGQGFNRILEHYPNECCYLERNYHSSNIPKELIAESSDRSAGADLRRNFVELIPIVKSKDPKKLENLVNKSIDICRSQNWFDQMVVTYLIAGAAYLNWKENNHSLISYQNAVIAAKQSLENKHPAGEKLVANALFGEASVYLINKDYQQAVKCYEAISEYTVQAKDYILTVEAWRMVAFCWKKEHENRKAIQAGLNALDIGFQLDNDLRVNSSLPIAIKALLKIVPDEQEDEVEQKLTLLYGESWQEILASINV